MIECRNCSVCIGLTEDFGTLCFNNSYHFVARNCYIDKLENENIVNVSDELQENAFFIVHCSNCNFEIGKKFVNKNRNYIAFGKEKLIYDEIRLEKTDKWVNVLKTPEFSAINFPILGLKEFILSSSINKISIPGDESSLDQELDCRDCKSKFLFTGEEKDSFKKKEFSDPVRCKACIDRKKNVIPRPGSVNNKANFDKKSEIGNLAHGKIFSRQIETKITTPHIKEAPSPHYQTNQEPRKNIVRATPTVVRGDIGSTPADKLKFLESKVSQWGTDQLVFEFTGPNKKNWEKIMEDGILSDSSLGKLMRCILKLLANPEVSSHPQATHLFIPMKSPTGILGMTSYLQMGPLGNGSVKAALKQGRGGPLWLTAMDDAIDFTETVSTLMRFFADCQVNPSIPIESLSLRIQSLIGHSFSEENPNMSEWFPGLREDEKQRCLLRASHLHTRINCIDRLQQSAMEAATEHAQNREEEEKEAAEMSRLSNQRARSGVQFLNDPKRDKDYLGLSEIPGAVDLLSAAPEALPQNLVLSLGRKRDHEDDSTTIGSSNEDVSKGPKLPKQFRSTHHYLNTHFLLNREDCLAQLRRGLSSYREKIIAHAGIDPKSCKAGIKIVNPPTTECFKKVAKAISMSRDNDRIFIYENVCIHKVDKVQGSIGYSVSFDVFGSSKKIDWTRSSERFKNGSLLCLSPDGTFNEDSLIVATVLRGVQPPKEGNGNGWTPTIVISVDNMDRFDPTVVYVMIESVVFFEAYRPVLTALKRIGRDGDFPLSDIMLGLTTKVPAPSYLLAKRTAIVKKPARTPAFSSFSSVIIENERPADAMWDMSAVFPDFELANGTKYWNPDLLNPVPPVLPNFPELDESQKKAILLALTKRLAIIQGPPGTGKTFVGALISKLLLSNQNLREKKPILFVCQTNHALDQMLEHVYEFNRNIIRVGGRSESEIMKSLNISNFKNGFKSSRNQEEFDAMFHMHISRVGLQLALVQQRACYDEVNISKAPMLQNSVLARLCTLLENLYPGTEQLVHDLVDRCPAALQDSLWKTCKKISNASSSKHAQSHFADNRDDWDALDVDRKIVLLATYVDSNSAASPLQLADHWVCSGSAFVKTPKVNHKNISAEWQTVGGNIADYGREDSVDDLVDEELDDNEFLAEFEEDWQTISNDDSDRYLDDEDDETPQVDDYFFNREVSGRQSDEDIVRNVVTRATDTKALKNSLSPAELLLLKNSASKSIWKLSRPERVELFLIWVTILRVDAIADVAKFSSDYKRAAEVDSKYNARVESLALRSADVVGMTTNGSAKYNTLLRTLQPEIIIVEEAAEILEASIIAAITPSTKQMILIGDHLQLRPQVVEHNLAVHHGLEISLFERLVRLGLPHVTLTTQRRMHPEISSLINPSIYKSLKNADSVNSHPEIRGIRGRLYFISHTFPEDGHALAWGDSKGRGQDKMPVANKKQDIGVAGLEMSKTNSHEAKYLARLLEYLLLNGYKANQIVVLSMYKGQVNLMRRLAKDLAASSSLINTDNIDKIRMTTTDNYQGEESDIVLLSLVRSNVDGKAGFVKIHNRICVALSRARNGLYVIGNMTMFQATSDLWNGICKDLTQRGKLGDGLMLTCSIHNDSPAVHAVIAADFDKCPHGGCMRQCNAPMQCGHTCLLICHPISHDQIKCNQTCLKKRPIECPHPCKRPCWQDCGPCQVKVQKLRALCKHSVHVACSFKVDENMCYARCDVPMLCAHRCPEICHISGSHDFLTYKCRSKCSRTRSTCSHPCKNLCYESCGDCMVIVSRKLACGHIVKVACSADVSVIDCTSRCDAKLLCGHQCSKLCGMDCDIDCVALVEKTIVLCSQIPQHRKKVLCSQDIANSQCDVKCNDSLLCGHRCGGTCSTCNTVPDDRNGYRVNHIECKRRCERRLDCNHKCDGQHLCGDTSNGCSPCQNPCETVCDHGECDLLCGEPCRPCMEPCKFNCLHLSCVNLCHEVHSMVSPKAKNAMLSKVIASGKCDHDVDFERFCRKDCKKILRCGHNCLGICGERCPDICMECGPSDFVERLSFFELPTNLSSLFSANNRFLELSCGHCFEVGALDRHMKKFEIKGESVYKTQNIRIPPCPECGRTAEGTFRYRQVILQARRLLEPSRQMQQEHQLFREVETDLQNNLAGLVVDRLRSIKSNSPRYSSMHVISLLLGQALLKLGDLRGAMKALQAAIDETKSSVFQKEVLISLGLLHLGGSCDDIAISSVSIERLELALSFFCKALDIVDQQNDFEHPRTFFSKGRNEIKAAVQRIEFQIDLKRKIEMKKLEDLAEKRRLAKKKQDALNAAVVAAALASSKSIVQAAEEEKRVDEAKSSCGGSALHAAARRGRVAEVRDLLLAGADLNSKDDLGNTPLMCAAIQRNTEVLRLLVDNSPWHTVNNSGDHFLMLLLTNDTRLQDTMEYLDFANEVEMRAKETMGDEGSTPSHAWAAAKFFDKASCVPMDELMDMTGIKSVKAKALELYHAIKIDMKRSPKTRICIKQAMNFIFVGNPGTGKTTVARIFGEILSDLGLREDGKFIETSGQKLLSNGASKFSSLLADATPGVLFIDEVYQLDPAGNSDGKAITNSIMEATENDREKLTVIVAGYRDDVREKWISFNPGLSSRFPLEVCFEDFSEQELRIIFNKNVSDYGWQIESYALPDSLAQVDPSLVAARRLARSANRKGFANARSVRVMVEQSMRAASVRQKQEQLERHRSSSLSPTHSITLTLQDIIGKPFNLEESPLVQELMSMVGLDDVKASVMGLLKMAIENYNSEMKGDKVLDISLHRMFLGNPGTGKTTIAKVYGKILKAIGYLSNGEVVLVGASKLVGQYVGSTQKIVNDLMDSIKGKVLVIDEAYVLAGDRQGSGSGAHGREALDTLVERVQGGAFEDFAVILCGYEDEMLKMIRDGNPGLSRRFRSEDSFHFQDYDDEQLETIMQTKAVENALCITPALAKAAVKNVLAKQRAKPNFGNVGAINNLFHHAKEKLMLRDDRSKCDGRWLLVQSDLFEEPPADAPMKALENLVNADDILNYINQMKKRVQVQIARGTDPKKLLKNYVFIGQPGTGKTTVARAFGEVFHGLGLLSSTTVVECKAMELIAGYVGQSSKLVKDKMDEARGGVLFIDEAYGLNPSNSAFAKDAIEMLLANMTDPKYEGNMVIILAGYPNEIEELLQSNPGLKRRITERLTFKTWNEQSCLELLLKLSQKEGTSIPEILHEFIIEGFSDLIGRDGWGNAGDVMTVHDKMLASRDSQCDDVGNVSSEFIIEDVMYAFNEMISQRPNIMQSSPLKKSSSNIAPSVCQSSYSKPVKQLEFDSPNEVVIEYESDNEALVEPIIKGLEEEESPSDDDLWFALDEAFAHMGYTIYVIRDILVSQILPGEVVDFVATKLKRDPRRIEKMLVLQCPLILPGVAQLIEKIELELELLRQKREEIERADAAEKARLELIEKQRQNEMKLERLKMIGRCPMNFEWIQCGNGYRCAGGSHFVSHGDLNIQ